MGNKATIRLAAQLCCISDYFLTGKMERATEDELNAQSCVNALREMGTKCQSENFAEKEHATNCWSTYTKGKEHIGIKEMLALSDNWDFKTANIEYQTTKHDLLSVEKLRQTFVFNGGDMYAMEQTLGLYRWEVMDCMKYGARIPRILRNVMNNHLDPADELSWQEVREEMDKIRENNKMGLKCTSETV